MNKTVFPGQVVILTGCKVNIGVDTIEIKSEDDVLVHAPEDTTLWKKVFEPIAPVGL